tara:strand:- start:1963 stop:2487 length:525 start_codon:yes stop_codon:yes gene_type:complete
MSFFDPPQDPFFSPAHNNECKGCKQLKTRVTILEQRLAELELSINKPKSYFSIPSPRTRSFRSSLQPNIKEYKLAPCSFPTFVSPNISTMDTDNSKNYNTNSNESIPIPPAPPSDFFKFPATQCSTTKDGNCNTCSTPMKSPNKISFWDNSSGSHLSKDSWTCDACDGRSVKMF